MDTVKIVGTVLVFAIFFSMFLFTVAGAVECFITGIKDRKEARRRTLREERLEDERIAFEREMAMKEAGSSKDHSHCHHH